MKSVQLYIIIFISFLAISLTGKEVDIGEKPNGRKLERARLKADRSYHSFSYSRSIKQYKKVLSLSPSDGEATLRIADSFRKINDIDKAREWYAKADGIGVLTEKQDQLNYAQVLSSSGHYDEADKWYKTHGEEGIMAELIKNRREAIENIDSYYQDTAAYFVDLTNFNTEHSDFGPAYTSEGIVFASARPSKGLFKPKYSWDNSNFLDMFTLDEKGEVVKIQRGINTRYHEGPATFFDNDSKVIFTRNNFHKGKSGESEDGVTKLKLYYAEKSKNGKKWCPPVELPFNSDDYSVGHPTVSKDGKTLFFASDMPGGEGGSDIYKSTWNGEKWNKAENLGSIINTPGNEFFPFVHQDDILYYASEGMPGLGGLDIYSISLKNPVIPVNLGYPINTNKDDFGIILSDDGRSGYLSSNREDGIGHDDIYSFEKYFYNIKVKLVNADTKLPIEASIVGEIAGQNKRLIDENSTSEASFRILRGPSISLNVTKKGYEGITKSVETVNLPKILEDDYVIELPLKPITEPDKELFEDVIIVENNGINTQIISDKERLVLYNGTFDRLKSDLKESGISVGKVLKIRNIYYDFDQYDIRADAAIELDHIVSILKTYLNLKVNLSAHTDVRGTIKYNDVLANNRVKEAKDYLIEQGISDHRVLINSFGKKNLFIECNKQCNEDMHQSNRRTEISLIID